MPLLLIVAVAVLVSMGRPVMFTQKRPGRNAKVFTLCKFRTMDASDAVSDVAAVASDNMRLTRFGKLLRATSLDELPQLFNIVRGDMSLVGPRPLLCEYLPLYSEQQARRMEVRPGMTGLAQINGRNATSWDERFTLDVEYVDARSFVLDCRILAKTVSAVFSRTGTSDDSATMTPFTGR